MKIEDYKKIIPINKEELFIPNESIEDSEILNIDECLVNDFR